MIRLMPARLTPSSWESRWTSRSSATSRGLYRRPPPGVRPGLTRPSRSYWRSVCACMPASSAATEITKTGGVLGDGTGRVLRAGSPLAPSLHRRRDLRPRVPVQLLGEALDDLALRRRSAARDGDVDGDEQVAGPALAGHAAAAHPQGPAARRCRRAP